MGEGGEGSSLGSRKKSHQVEYLLVLPLIEVNSESIFHCQLHFLFVDIAGIVRSAIAQELGPLLSEMRKLQREVTVKAWHYLTKDVHNNIIALWTDLSMEKSY